jgi:hypothetical protein
MSYTIAEAEMAGTMYYPWSHGAVSYKSLCTVAYRAGYMSLRSDANCDRVVIGADRAPNCRGAELRLWMARLCEKLHIAAGRVQLY